MSITPTNNLAKLGIAAAVATRNELADQLFFPIAVNIYNPSQPMMGGTVGNRSGQPRRLTGDGNVTTNTKDGDGGGGNTAGFGADFSALEGDPVTIIKTNTSDGVIYTVQKYDGSGVITVEDASLNNLTTGSPPPGGVGGTRDYTTVARYIVKADGVIYDLLSPSGIDANPTNPAASGPYRHWQMSADTSPGYTAGTNTYIPGNDSAGVSLTANNIVERHYMRAVGRISFRPKEGASSGAIQEQLTRTQSIIDTMSRLLRSLHDESKGPFANMVIR